MTDEPKPPRRITLRLAEEAARPNPATTEVDEYGTRLTSGGYQTWNTEPGMERFASLAERIELERQHGKVYRRRIIVVDDWAEVAPDSLAFDLSPDHHREERPAMRLATNPLSADAEPLDPSNPEPFIALAGSQFLGMDGETARYRSREGREGRAYPGWLVIRRDGSGDGQALFADPVNIGDGEIWGAAG